MAEEKPIKVLIAEDEIDLAEALNEALTDAGFSVVKTHDGEEALAQFKAEKPDMLLLDIHMPKMTGIEVLKSIREIEDENNHTPVTVLTASESLGAVSDVTRIGGMNTDFFGKTNLSLDQIVDHVRTRLSSQE